MPEWLAAVGTGLRCTIAEMAMPTETTRLWRRSDYAGSLSTAPQWSCPDLMDTGFR